MQRGIGLIGLAGFVVAAVLIGWLCGRLGQRVFDDEAISLAMIDGHRYGGLLGFYLGGGDVHPPLPFLWLRLLQDLQTPFWLQRALSLAGAAAGFGLVLDMLWSRLPDRLCRALAVVLFLGAPLLYGMGASLRWYPLLVLPVALALWSADRAGRPTLLAAIAFGVAANISFLAAIPALAYGIWRYLIVRQFDPRLDGRFIAVTAAIALPGLVAFAASLPHLPAQAESNVLVALGMTVLGVTGGYGLGLTDSVFAAPFVFLALAAFVIALVTAWRRPVDGLLAISLIIVLLCLALTATGFAKPRSFLFAVPFLLAAVMLGATRHSWRRWFAVPMAALSVVATVASLWLLNVSERPFKRNLHIADEEVLAVIRQHTPPGETFVMSSEPSLGWRLRREGYCVTAASLPGTCEQAALRNLVMIDDGTFVQRPGLINAFLAMSSGSRQVHRQVFGSDEDGSLKTFLTSRLVPNWLVTVTVYRRD